MPPRLKVHASRSLAPGLQRATVCGTVSVHLTDDRMEVTCDQCKRVLASLARKQKLGQTS